MGKKEAPLQYQQVAEQTFHIEAFVPLRVFNANPDLTRLHYVSYFEHLIVHHQEGQMRGWEWTLHRASNPFDVGGGRQAVAHEDIVRLRVFGVVHIAVQEMSPLVLPGRGR